MNVPLPSEVEFTVTVEAVPSQIDVADGEVKLVRLGVGFTVIVTMLDVAEGVVIQRLLITLQVTWSPFANAELL